MAPTFEQYLNIRSATAPTFRRDGARMAFLSDISGTAQLWTVDGPLLWPEQLTFFEGRLMFAEYSPTESILAFGRDVEGDENQLVYLISDEGGTAQPISVQTAKHIWGGWSPDGAKMAWSHNGRNGRDFDVYVYDLAAGTEEMIVQADGYMWVSAWFPDGTGLFVSTAASNANSDVLRAPFDGSPPVLLTEHVGNIVHVNITPLSDGSRCLLATNGGGEFLNVAELDLSTHAITELDPTAHWDVESLALSDDERWLVTVRNDDGYSSVRVTDRQTRNARTLASLPPGVVSGATFIPDSSQIALTLSGVADATDIWVVDVSKDSAQRWTRSSLGGVPRNSLVAPRPITYTSFDGLEVPALFWCPPGEGPFPVVIEIHGGPEGQRRPNLTSTAQYYLQRGIATLAPNVRGSNGYGKTYMALDDVRKRMHSVADIQAAHAWLTTHGGADPDRIALYGGSYGGFMVLSAMVTYPDLWAAGVDIVGIANFVTFLENTSEYRRHLRESEYGTLKDDRDFLLDISPLTHIHKIAAPLMVIHGRNDPRVPVSEAEQVVDACRAKGLPVECIIYDDEGHGLAKRKNRLDASPRVLAFLVEHLRLDAALA